MIKNGFLTFTILCTLILFGCDLQNEANAENIIGQLMNNIGKTKSDVFQDLGIEEGEDIQLYSGTMYEFLDDYFLYDEPFRLVIDFDMENEKMLSFSFRQTFDDPDEDGYDITEQLLEDLTDSYGEPTTYPELENRIIDMPAYEGLTENQYEYLETWEVHEELDVKVQMQSAIPGSINVYLTYQVSVSDLDDWND